jgi:acetyltransferase-like isoleucine patch superfamily enzyme
MTLKYIEDICYILWWKLRFKLGFLKPPGLKIKGSVTLKKGARLKLTENSVCEVTGHLVLENTSLIVKGSKMSIGGNTVFKNSNLLLENSEWKSGQGMNLEDTQMKLTGSSCNLGEFFRSSGYSFHLNYSKMNCTSYTYWIKHEQRWPECILHHSQFISGHNCKYEAFIQQSDSTLTIGDHVFINQGSEIRCFDTITLGSYIFVSYDCLIFDTNAHSTNPSDRRREIENGFPNGTRQDGTGKPKTAPVSIGDDVWIGMRSVILKGTTIGNGSIIALQSVVTGDVPAGHIAFGNPIQLRTLDVNKNSGS